jgi:uncharacterized DUF497 family protein
MQTGTYIWVYSADNEIDLCYQFYHERKETLIAVCSARESHKAARIYDQRTVWTARFGGGS